jgi:uncharacterized phage protein gp47/JayE
MAYRIPTTVELAAAFLVNFENAINQNSPLNDKAFTRVLSAQEALAIIGLYKFAVDAVKQNLALTATGEDLERIGAEYGVTKKQAEATVLTVEFTGTGTVDETNAFIGVGNGLRYPVDAPATGTGGAFAFSGTAEQPGAVGNLGVGAQVQLETAVAGISRSGTVTEITNLGVNEEDEEVYRDRVLFEIRTVGGGGNAVDYKKRSEEVSGVKRAYPYGGNPVSPGSSTPPERTVYIEAQEALAVDGIPPQTLLDEVRNNITTDPETGVTRQPLGLTDDTLFVEPITRTGFYVEVRGLTVAADKEAAAKADIDSDLTTYFKNVLPFVDGVDVEIERNDTITSLTISLTVQTVLVRYGATATSIGFGVILGSFLPDYTLGQGELAKLLQVNYD